MMTKQPAKTRQPLPRWAKITLKTIRILIIPVICILALIAGLYAGYTVLGKQSGDDVLKWDTWKHLYDLVFAD